MCKMFRWNITGRALKGIIFWCSLIASAYLQHSLWWCFQKIRLVHANRSPLCYFNEVYAVQGGARPQPGGKKMPSSTSRHWDSAWHLWNPMNKKKPCKTYSSTAMPWKQQRHWHDQASLRHRLPKLAIDASASFPHQGKIQMVEVQKCWQCYSCQRQRHVAHKKQHLRYKEQKSN